MPTQYRSHGNLSAVKVEKSSVSPMGNIKHNEAPG